MSAKDKKAKESVSTRERILDAALKLFNEKGETGVTTAQIAEYSGISEGNLWYHFRTKREIVFALFCRLEAAVDKNLSRLPDENLDLKDFINYAARAFEYLWEYRFFYRDRLGGANDTETITRLRELTVRGQHNVKRILDDMRRRGMLSLSAAETSALGINAWIIHSNWLRYLQFGENIQKIEAKHIEQGFAQLIRLFTPYLSEAGKREAIAFIEQFSLKDNNETTEQDSGI
jgi:AcrR family transcriptional regulator